MFMSASAQLSSFLVFVSKSRTEIYVGAPLPFTQRRLPFSRFVTNTFAKKFYWQR